jgi:SAM-dependent methyltransferase
MLRPQCVSAVLDAACGVGYGSMYLAEAGATVVGVDRDEGALSTARAKFAHPQVKFIRDDCQKLAQIPNGSFDAVVSFETLEHLSEPAEFLNRCRQVLRDQGCIIVSTPNGNLRENSAKDEWEFHEKEYSAKEFVNLLTAAGFRDIRLWGQTYTSIGRLRNQVRGELNRVHSNPLFRLGRVIQRIFRGHTFHPAILPESLDDFVLHEFSSAEEIDCLSRLGPFVIVAFGRR